MVHAKATAKKYIFKQGDLGNCFFIIQSGTVDVEIDGTYVRTLSKG
jgi:CRP-like cAMP-binding protein